MAVDPKRLPRLAQIALGLDWQTISGAFRTAVNEEPDHVYPISANQREASYALMYRAYVLGNLDTYVAALGQISASVKAQFDDVLGANAPCPTTVHLLWDRIPLIDRTSLRQRLLEIVQDDDSRVLAIKGVEASGKSHSGHLIAFVGVKKAGARLVPIMLLPLLTAKLSSTTSGSPAELEPYELMEQIALQLELDLPPQLRTARAQDARIVQKLLNWFAGAFGQRAEPAQPVWLIVDDLNFSGCPAWVAELMIGLADRFAMGQLDDLRIFLIGLGEERLNPQGRYFAVGDQHYPLTRDDVWQFMLDAAAERGTPLAPDDREVVLGRVWGTDPGPLRHKELQDVSARAALMLKGLG